MFKKCLKCGELVYILKGNSDIVCCGDVMKELIPNSVDASFEKHVPNVEREKDKLRVTVNHVMNEDHYIEWIALKTDQELNIKKLKPNQDATVYFDFVEKATIYAYCNKHGLWEKQI